MIYVKNNTKGLLTVGAVNVSPGKSAALDVDKDHKGLKAALQSKMLSEVAEKEYLAEHDPASLAEKEAADKEAAEKNKKGDK